MNMRQDAEWLLEEKYNGEKSDAFFADCKRLALGEPLGYLIGHVPFLDTTIYLDSRPLIPRPETEFWTEKVITRINERDLPAPKVLDLCAGSGCIGVAIAKAVPTALVDFCEIEADHLPTITKNLEYNNISPQRYQVVHSSLFDDLPYTYDFIVSNPPYIDETLNRVDSSVVDFEPHLALFGGDKGMEVITEIIKQAPDHLKPKGELWLEHEPEHSESIESLGNQHLFTVSTHRDQYGTERYSRLLLS